MGSYAVTGSYSGMGRAVVERLRSQGHEVITVDLADADVVADLATADGRATAIDGVLAACHGRLDGAVLAAGVGPLPGPDSPRLICRLNYRGVVDLLEAWRPALAATGAAKVVVFASNSTTTVPLVPVRAVRALLAGDTERALRTLRLYGGAAPAMAYAASKIAVARWVRRHAVRPEWAGEGIRLNAIAPGAVMTPLLERQLESPAEARQIKAFPVPVGGYGDADHLAEWVVFMLADTAAFLCGSVIYVDGGSDAYFRADDWPRPVPLGRVVTYLRRMRGFRPPAHPRSDVPHPPSAG